MRYFISLSYRGADYSGWQIQDNAPSIEGEVEKALSILLGSTSSVVGAGRTDAGVNAINYVAHFDSQDNNFFKDPRQFVYKINAILPIGITINDICQVNDTAHARFDATSRTYKYFLHTTNDPFAYDFSTFYKFSVDLPSMNRAASLLLGERDFSCFEKLHGGNATSRCNVIYAQWDKYIPNYLQKEDNEGYYVFTITANRFLRNMVRAIVGSLLEVGRGKKTVEWISELLDTGNRGMAGQSVPPYALFLTEVKYPYPLFFELNN